jgi:hypothetical protein
MADRYVVRDVRLAEGSQCAGESFPADTDAAVHCLVSSAENAASSVEDAAIEDLASMVLRTAELTGGRPEELLAGISDSALSDLYRSIAENICPARRTGCTALPDRWPGELPPQRPLLAEPPGQAFHRSSHA